MKRKIFTSNRSNLSESKTQRALRFFINQIVLSLLLLAVVPYVSAQQESYQPPTVAELDQFRQELIKVMHQLNKVGALKPRILVLDAQLKTKFDAAPSAAQVQQQLQQMNYEELAVVHKAFATFLPEWRSVPALVSRMTMNMSKASGPMPNAVVTPDNCNDAELLAPSFTDLAVARSLEIGAQAAYEGIPEPANFSALAFWLPLAVASWNGETFLNLKNQCHGDADIDEIKTSISKVDSRVSEVGNSIKENDNDNTGRIIRSIETGLATANTEVINNDNANKAMLVTTITNTKNEIINNDNANTTTLNTNLANAQTAIITNNNTNATNIINNINSNAAALRDLMLRTQIEADLAEADNATYVGLYVTPSANGGYFDFARFIVVDTIAKLAGSNTSQANGFLAQSDVQRNAGNFKAAYQWLRKAYKTAVN
jgi:hypothetical protein